MSREVYDDGVVVERWDDVTRQYTNYRTNPDTVRAYTPAENAAADAEALVITYTANLRNLTALPQLQGRLTRLAAYATDAEVVAALARTNNTAPTTQELNRLLKVMLRREERLSATLAMLVRLLNPELLTDITDTTDA
jgi:hypothetical protein